MSLINKESIKKLKEENFNYIPQEYFEKAIQYILNKKTSSNGITDRNEAIEFLLTHNIEECFWFAVTDEGFHFWMKISNYQNSKKYI